jgi:hypothetical protein
MEVSDAQRTKTEASRAEIAVTYPADAGATTFLLTVRGKVRPAVADTRELHNQTAGSSDGIAAARALGDLSHNVFTTAGNGADPDELLFIDFWNSPTGLGQFFATEQVQAGAAALFTQFEGILWGPTTEFGNFHLLPPAGATVAGVGMLRATVSSLEAAAPAFNAYGAATINTARRYGQLAHSTWSRLPNPGETIAPEVLGVDLWSNLEQMAAFYELGLGFDKLGPGLADQPRTSVWRAAEGEWAEW